MIPTRPQLTLERLYKTKLLAHKNDPLTSQQAAKKMINSGDLSNNQNMVMRIIRRYCETHEDFTPLDLAGGERNTLYFEIQRRKNELANKGLIRESGKERDGCEVWQLIERI